MTAAPPSPPCLPPSVPSLRPSFPPLLPSLLPCPSAGWVPPEPPPARRRSPAAPRSRPGAFPWSPRGGRRQPCRYCLRCCPCSPSTAPASPPSCGSWAAAAAAPRPQVSTAPGRRAGAPSAEPGRPGGRGRRRCLPAEPQRGRRDLGGAGAAEPRRAPPRRPPAAGCGGGRAAAGGPRCGFATLVIIITIYFVFSLPSDRFASERGLPGPAPGKAL